MKHTLRILALSILLVPAAAQDPCFVLEQNQAKLQPGDHELGVLVESIGSYLGVNLLLDPSECASGDMRVRIRQPIAVAGDQAWDLLNAVLAHRSMAIIPLNPELKLYEVINLSGGKRAKVATAAIVVDEADIEKYARWSATPIIVRASIEYCNATIMTNSLRPFFAGQGGGSSGGISIGSVGNSSSLLVSGMGDQVVAAVRLLRTIDQAAQPEVRASHVVGLKHVDSGQLAVQLSQFVAQGGPSTNGDPSTPMSVVAAPNQNAIMVSGTEQDVAQALSIIAAMDVTGPKPRATPPSEIEALAEQVRELQEKVEALSAKKLDSKQPNR